MTRQQGGRPGDWPARKVVLYVIVFLIAAIILTARVLARVTNREERDGSESYVRINTYEEGGQVRLKVGDTRQLSYSCSEDLKEEMAVWTSSDSGIVSVKDGRLTAKRKGTVIITVRIGNNSSDCSVIVQRRFKKVR